MINTSTKFLAILGNPVSHSFSPQMHNIWFARENLNFAYLAFAPSQNNLKKTVQSLKILGFYGANITVPYKVSIMKELKFIDKAAKKIGSVNTLKFKDGKLYGYNTDYLGLLKDWEDKKINFSDQNVLVVGAGGAAKAVIYALKIKKPKNIFITNRTLSKAASLAGIFKIKVLPVDKVESSFSNVDILINASSCGMNKDDRLFFKISDFNKQTIMYDLIYNKNTPFIEFAKSKKLKFYSGIGMLVRQGAYSFKIWTGIYPSIKTAENFFKKLS
ncbi:MAG: shikimate dehydrogenase [Elusimicrobiota bacterium]|jgi:shikimate dehydrogenase|nr:shikimate dehydrogenase [Elusimicrobiota bacterium]